jgi:hypothetical protein
MLGLLGQMVTVGAHAVGLATHATPAMGGEDLTEAYLTQPAVMADATFGPLQFAGMFNFEGWTLDRGELNAGVWGEGYSDRRHPHTFLHEAMLTIEGSALGGRASLSAGRGFAPFGTDDPMVRPLVKYPTNHHLSQILERWVVSGAVRGGPVIIEGGWFNGVEPVDPEDLGDVDKFGDSWSARLTFAPRSWLEIQGSYAEVESPENQFGGGLDHEMWNVSARAQRQWGAHDVYALVELGQTIEGQENLDAFKFHTFLSEAAVKRGRWQMAARFEHSERPEEERTVDPFRTVRPATDNSIVGVTQWTIGTLNVSHTLRMASFMLQPFVEVARIHVEATEEFPVFIPEFFYGDENMWSFSFGIRSTIGAWHSRMGRYGAARVQNSHQHH